MGGLPATYLSSTILQSNVKKPLPFLQLPVAPSPKTQTVNQLSPTLKCEFIFVLAAKIGDTYRRRGAKISQKKTFVYSIMLKVDSCSSK